MNQIKPKEKYVFTFAQDEKGEDVKYRFMLTLSKRIDNVIEPKLIAALGTLDGIDGIQPGIGRYTIQVTIARTFDADEIIAELKNRLDDVMSDIIIPKMIVP